MRALAMNGGPGTELEPSARHLVSEGDGTLRAVLGVP